MNAQQRKYALERIEAIRASKEAALKLKHTTKAIFLSKGEKLEMIRSGKATLLKSTTESYYGSLVVAYDFSKYEKSPVLSAAGKTAIDKLNKQAQSIKDTVALGESSAALEAIAAFEK